MPNRNLNEKVKYFKDVIPDLATNKLTGTTKQVQSLRAFPDIPNVVLDSPRELLPGNPDRNNTSYFSAEEPLLNADAIFATIHLPLLVLGKDFCIKKASASFYNTFSITENEALGKILFDLRDGQWNIPGLRDKLLKVSRRDGLVPEWVASCTFLPAGKRTICFNARRIQNENPEDWILLTIDDITTRNEKELAEKKNLDDLQKILENIPQITLTTAADGTVTYLNRYFLNYSGMSIGRALKRGFEPLIKPDVLKEFRNSLSHKIETGQDFKMELQLKNKLDNTYRWHLYCATPVRNEGVINFWVGTAIDLQEQKSKEQAKDEFMNIASHEMKTPLTSAKAFIQLLQLSMEKANNKDLIYANKAVEAINRLNDLILELLDVNKIQNGKLDLNIATFDFDEMIAAAIDGVHYSSPSHTIIKKGGIKEKITGDKARLQQVVVNLLGNAIKYSPKAHKVIVTTGIKDGELRVSIKDRGIGIERENLWKIFERYYREEDRTIHFQGLGIGLYISYDIIQRHKGKLWAQRNVGKGSTFYFTLPL